MSFWDDPGGSISGTLNHATDSFSNAIGTSGGGGGGGSIFDSFSKAIGTDGSGGGLSGELNKVGQNVSQGLSDLGNDIGYSWHNLSAPIVDTGWGRTLATIGASMIPGVGPWAAAGLNAGFEANDRANGKFNEGSTLGNIFRGVGGYYSAGGGNTNMGSGATGLTPTPTAEGLTATGNNVNDFNFSGSDFNPNYSLSAGGTNTPMVPPSEFTPNYSLGTGAGATPGLGVDAGTGLNISPNSFGPTNSNWMSKLADAGINIGRQAAGQTPLGKLAGLADPNVPTWLKFARGAAGLYSSNQQLKQAQDNQAMIEQQQRQLSDMYSPNSPYAQQLQQTLARKDAASGRNSQYGTRAVQLQAMLADKANQTALGQAQLSNANNLAMKGANDARSNALNSLLMTGQAVAPALKDGYQSLVDMYNNW